MNIAKDLMSGCFHITQNYLFSKEKTLSPTWILDRVYVIGGSIQELLQMIIVRATLWGSHLPHAYAKQKSKKVSACLGLETKTGELELFWHRHTFLIATSEPSEDPVPPLDQPPYVDFIPELN